MKTVVSVNEISEFEIKPQAELSTWKSLVQEELHERWLNKAIWSKVECPVCNSDQSTPAFEKTGFSYVECNDCKSLFVQSRPDSSELNWWYTKSRSAQFWREKLLKLSAASRNAKIIEPRAHWIMDGVSEYMPSGSLNKIRYTDISYFGKMLTDKIAELSGNFVITAAGVTAAQEVYDTPGIKVKAIASTDDLSVLERADIVVAVDVLDRISNIPEFLRQLETVVAPGGLVFATCPVSSGFEIQSLWDKSPSIIPPDKLNLPSVKGLLETLASRSKWEVLELSTPGMFDVELVRQQLESSPKDQWPRALHALLDGINKQGAGLFTEYLQSQRLSSFARIVLRKEKDKIM